MRGSLPEMQEQPFKFNVEGQQRLRRSQKQEPGFVISTAMSLVWIYSKKQEPPLTDKHVHPAILQCQAR